MIRATLIGALGAMTKSKPNSAGSLLRRPLLVAALAAGVLIPASTMAAVDIYLKLGGIDGESTDDRFLKWIPLESYEVGFDSGVVTRHATGATLTRKPGCSALSAVKYYDAASPHLMAAVMAGTHYPSAQVHFVRPGGLRPVFLKYELEDVVVSSLSTAAVAGASAQKPTESMSLNFSRLTVTYYPQKADGSLDAAIVRAVNCAGAQ